MKILIKNCIIVPMTGEDYFKGSIGIEDSKIVMVTKDEKEIDNFQIDESISVIDADGKIAMPGLINTHTHASMTLMRGFSDDMQLMDWLVNKIWPIEAKLTEDDIYWGAKLSIIEMLKSGTTTYSDMYWNLKANAKVVEDTGIRSYFGITTMDACIDNVCENIDNNFKEYNNSCNGRFRLMIAPHAPYTCSPDTLTKSVDIAKKYSLILHTHLSETTGEIEDIKAKYGVNPIEYYEQNGVFELPVIAAHCVAVSDDDILKLKKYNVSVAHNPISNMKLASGVAPVAKMIEMGLNVSIGTDGASSNNNLDMFEELRTATLLQKLITSDPTALKAYDALYMATVAGAKALGREDELGQIKEGMIADIILIDSNEPHLNPLHNVIASLVYSGKGSDVTDVIIDGNILLRDRKFVNIDVKECLEQVSNIAVRLRN